MGFCCPNWFKDNFLEQHIIKLSSNKGKCSFCETDNIALISTNKLQDLFEEIMYIYEVNDSGVLFSEILNLDWKLFKINKYVANNLLSEILNDKDLLSQKFINSLEKTSSDVWDKFRDELKYNNRYFPNDSEFNKQSLKETIQFFKTLDYPKEVFRARISKDNNLIPKEKMGKPPLGRSTQGRANPIGISYLYVASDIKTAISEIRPHKGALVTVAKIKLPDNLKFLDIRSPKNTISPFSFSDNVLEALYKDLDLLERFGEELSKPVLPQEADMEYLSSQYLCEMIKHYGFTGLLYKSSVGEGFNIVIFDNVELDFLELEMYEIRNIIIDSICIKTS